MPSIRISNDLLEELNKKKKFNDDNYEGVIWELLEDTMELSEETKKNIQQSRKDIKAGRVYSHEEVKKELGL
mgnify:CR=1 FL=1|tara:strand:- start:187 stop:402 length:216 start_codon:yes stop_codon:yes gene_type:complete